jgi:hypothetical protein
MEQHDIIEGITNLGGGWFRIEPLECPKCGGFETRIVDKSQLFCLACGGWSDPYSSPSVKRVIAQQEQDGGGD